MEQYVRNLRATAEDYKNLIRVRLTSYFIQRKNVTKLKTNNSTEWFHIHSNNEQGVDLTGRNTTGPPCSRGALIRLEAA